VSSHAVAGWRSAPDRSTRSRMPTSAVAKTISQAASRGAPSRNNGLPGQTSVPWVAPALGNVPRMWLKAWRGECDPNAMRLALTRTRVVLITFVLFTVAPFAYAMTRSWFWEREHSTAPVATALFVLVVVALVLGRYRWAWILLAVFYGGGIVAWGFDSHRFAPRHVLGLALDVVVFGLLVSSPMRDRLRRPVGIRARRTHLSQG
jgi:hypothetical protein